MADNAAVRIEPSGRAIVVDQQGRTLASGWIVVDMDEFPASTAPVATKLLFVGKRQDSTHA